MRNLFLSMLVLSSYVALGQAEDTIYTATDVNVQAQYLYGPDSLLSFIKNNLKIPRQELENGSIKKKVLTSFVVEKDGLITNRKILKGPSDILNEEAMRLLLIMPNRWTPAKNDGSPVRSVYNLPILFEKENKYPDSTIVMRRVPLISGNGTVGAPTEIEMTLEEYEAWREDHNWPITSKPYSASTTVKYSFSVALYEQGKYEQAIIGLDELYKTDPQNADLLFQRGLVYLKLDKLLKACKDFKASMNSGHPKAHEWIFDYCK